MTDIEKYIEKYIESKLADLSSYLKPKRPVYIYIKDDAINKFKSLVTDEAKVFYDRFEEYFDNLPEETKKRIRGMNKVPNYFMRIIFDEKEVEELHFGKERVREQDTEKSAEDNNR